MIRAVIFAILIGMAVSVLLVSINGCTASVEEVRGRAVDTWTAENCFSLLVSNMQHNLHLQRNIYVVITPFNVEVAEAITRIQQIKYGFQDAERIRRTDALLKQGMGLYRDKQGRLWTPQGHYDGKVDSVMFLVNLYNKAWPCEPPTFNGVPVIRMADMPCPTPDISKIESQIALINDRGAILHPSTVWGRENDTLTDEEHIFIVFDFTRNRDFQTGKLKMVIGGLGEKVEFALNK